RRATGKMLGTHLRDMETDIHCGLTDESLARVGPMVKPPAPPDLGEITQLKKAAFLSKWSSAGGAPREAWIRAEIPSSNMHATSGSLAQLMQLFVSDHHQVTKAIQNEALKERIQGDDLVLPFHLSWAAGLMKNTNHILGPSPTALGHYGFGGACVLVDPAHRLSFAYVPNKMSPALVADPRALLLLQAVYDAL
ncbi:MAG: serine hydrolase, partial [Pseudomonadota bacterium]